MELSSVTVLGCDDEVELELRLVLKAKNEAPEECARSLRAELRAVKVSVDEDKDDTKAKTRSAWELLERINRRRKESWTRRWKLRWDGVERLNVQQPGTSQIPDTDADAEPTPTSSSEEDTGWHTFTEEPRHYRLWHFRFAAYKCITADGRPTCNIIIFGVLAVSQCQEIVFRSFIIFTTSITSYTINWQKTIKKTKAQNFATPRVSLKMASRFFLKFSDLELSTLNMQISIPAGFSICAQLDVIRGLLRFHYQNKIGRGFSASHLLSRIFVYSITTWAAWVEATIGFLATDSVWIGKGTSFLGIAIYLLLNWSYTTAVFTNPGTTTASNNGYNSLPTRAPPVATNFTGQVKWRASILQEMQCAEAGSGTPLLNVSNMCLENGSPLPMAGYMSGFTGWHILLASRGQTTIECLEKTRYLSPLRKSMQHHHISQQMENPLDYGQQMNDMHGGSGVLPNEDVHHDYHESTHQGYDAYERQRARNRYEEYLDEQDSDKLPSAFDLGWKRNLLHLFGPRKSMWLFPIPTTTGDGWSWEPSPKWLDARERISREREEQRQREHAAGWGEPPSPQRPKVSEGAGRHYVTSYPSRAQSKADRVLGRPQSKADRILGREPDQYADETPGRTNNVSMQTLHPRDDEFEISSDEGELEQRPLDRKATIGWPHSLVQVGVVTNTLLGNTLARQKDDSRGWDGQDDGVD
ncbi:hypothetical protein G7Y89_g1640 [Cudoniella acicularis]|uniref:Uncharacterized protein n=1 Tax=Cudoniella acicularis TaxID=354080 RepID=A0A8H4RVZ4_9HELO|nr:hypothetical protein G7Y89_g1640 [Cudoniella acicularis]